MKIFIFLSAIILLSPSRGFTIPPEDQDEEISLNLRKFNTSASLALAQDNFGSHSLETEKIPELITRFNNLSPEVQHALMAMAEDLGADESALAPWISTIEETQRNSCIAAMRGLIPQLKSKFMGSQARFRYFSNMIWVFNTLPQHEQTPSAINDISCFIDICVPGNVCDFPTKLRLQEIPQDRRLQALKDSVFWSNTLELGPHVYVDTILHAIALSPQVENPQSVINAYRFVREGHKNKRRYKDADFIPCSVPAFKTLLNIPSSQRECAAQQASTNAIQTWESMLERPLDHRPCYIDALNAMHDATVKTLQKYESAQ